MKRLTTHKSDQETFQTAKQLDGDDKSFHDNYLVRSSIGPDEANERASKISYGTKDEEEQLDINDIMSVKSRMYKSSKPTYGNDSNSSNNYYARSSE